MSRWHNIKFNVRDTYILYEMHFGMTSINCVVHL